MAQRTDWLMLGPATSGCRTLGARVEKVSTTWKYDCNRSGINRSADYKHKLVFFVLAGLAMKSDTLTFQATVCLTRSHSIGFVPKNKKHFIEQLPA